MTVRVRVDGKEFELTGDREREITIAGGDQVRIEALPDDEHARPEAGGEVNCGQQVVD